MDSKAPHFLVGSAMALDHNGGWGVGHGWSPLNPVNIDTSSDEDPDEENFYDDKMDHSAVYSEMEVEVEDSRALDFDGMSTTSHMDSSTATSYMDNSCVCS